jgi:hypothetical protein
VSIAFTIAVTTTNSPSSLPGKSSARVVAARSCETNVGVGAAEASLLPELEHPDSSDAVTNAVEPRISQLFFSFMNFPY